MKLEGVKYKVEEHKIRVYFKVQLAANAALVATTHGQVL
jgi:hypothetical protein